MFVHNSKLFKSGKGIYQPVNSELKINRGKHLYHPYIYIEIPHKYQPFFEVNLMLMNVPKCMKTKKLSKQATQCFNYFSSAQ